MDAISKVGSYVSLERCTYRNLKIIRGDEHYHFSCFTGMYGRLSKSKSNAFINYPPETK